MLAAGPAAVKAGTGGGAAVKLAGGAGGWDCDRLAADETVGCVSASSAAACAEVAVVPNPANRSGEVDCESDLMPPLVPLP